jgi:hypothetical protein
MKRLGGYLTVGSFFGILVFLYINYETDIEFSTPFLSWYALITVITLLSGLFLSNAAQNEEEAKQRERNIILTPEGSPVPKTNLQKLDYYGPRILILLIIIGLFAYLLDSFF